MSHGPCGPSVSPTPVVTAQPTIAPTVAPTAQPTTAPTVAPTTNPTAAPTVQPTTQPIANPTSNPTIAPTGNPTTAPTNTPVVAGVSTGDGKSDGLGCAVKDCSGNVIPQGGVVLGVSTDQLPSTGGSNYLSFVIATIVMALGFGLKKYANAQEVNFK